MSSYYEKIYASTLAPIGNSQHSCQCETFHYKSAYLPDQLSVMTTHRLQNITITYGVYGALSYPTPASFSNLTFFTLFTLLQPHGHPHCSSLTPTPLLPQILCTCCSLCWGTLSPDLLMASGLCLNVIPIEKLSLTILSKIAPLHPFLSPLPALLS